MDTGSYQRKYTDRIFVTGHINPDTDSIASAIGYAWLLAERDGEPTVATRAGAVNMQTAFVLENTEHGTSGSSNRRESTL